MIQALMISLVLTEAVELACAWAMKIRQPRDLALVFMVNLITNPIAVSITWLFWHNLPEIALRLSVELAAIVTEALFYKRLQNQIPHPWRLSLLANAVSYSSGLLFQLF